MEKITVTINGKKYSATAGQTILELAQENGIKISNLCYHPDVETRSLCRMCMVEIRGDKNLQTACSTKVVEGMEIITESEKIKKLRKINLELIFS